MSSIFRFRPSNELTIDEFKNGYLWFARPTEYNDSEDSNIIGFAEKNEKVKDTFNRVFSNYLEMGKEVGNNGICCFSESLPKLKDWKLFPKGFNGIVIEYDKNILEEYFIQKYGIGDCFKKVEYLSNPLIFESTDDNLILWEVEDDGFIYKTLNEIGSDQKIMDEFFLKLFTRINVKYDIQKELRVILGGRNIPDNSPDLKGYKIIIPDSSFIKIYIHPKTPEKFVQDLRTVIPINIPFITMKKN